MEIPFFKYQGTGNDFIVIDNRTGLFDPNNIQLVVRLCSRRFGIGSDGLILIQDYPGLDFEMVFFNPDGSKSLCGNGSRCAVRFAQKLGIVQGSANFHTIDGPLRATIEGELIVLEMKNIDPIEFIDKDIFIDNGSPHYISFQTGVSDLNVYDSARKIRFNDRFQIEGTNVNFVEIVAPNKIINRTYERGVENETLSCGTGVVAAAIAAHSHQVNSPVEVSTLGGNLKVQFDPQDDGTFTNVKLIGPAEMVFQGTYKV